MNIFGHDWSFWVVLFLSVLVRVLTSPFHSMFRSTVLVLTSVLIAWSFSGAFLDYLHLNPEIYEKPVVALLALTADGFVRALLNVAQKPEQLLELWQKFRGGGK